jgi:hypothetical protein
MSFYLKYKYLKAVLKELLNILFSLNVLIAPTVVWIGKFYELEVRPAGDRLLLEGAGWVRVSAVKVLPSVKYTTDHTDKNFLLPLIGIRLCK